MGGRFPTRHGNIAIEIGHVGAPARLLQTYNLPLWPCGCGKPGCFEQYMSGAALTQICRHITGQPLSGAEVVQRADAGAPEMQKVLEIWCAALAECVLTLQLTIAPDVIVLGGGASQIPSLLARLHPELVARQLGDTRLPDIRVAQHGDTSGARGMALYAARQHEDLG